MPTRANQHVFLIAVQRVVMSTGFGIRIVLAVQRIASISIGGIPTDTFISPTFRDKHVPLITVQRVMVVTGIGVIQTVHRNRRLNRCAPTNTLVHPANASKMIALVAVCRVEVLAGIRIVETVHVSRALIC